ncbi:glycoside hydrolase family 55 protein [Chryseobacterium lathyri]|uniref:glycoside hydrolase family 55 protein n=1 Tax=Chryseobacterium lathyri TaxID=395933 RepID=UPI001CBFFE49|nr:glycoside hydrolase family 55 protein [Chryseobacterium lathyri]
MNTIEINDPYIGEWTTFIETDKTYNGDIIIDAYCDDILYKKVGSVYYRRVLEDSRVDIRWFGALPDGVTDCSDAIQQAFISADQFKLSVTAGKGTYLVTKTIYIPQNDDPTFLSKTYDFNESVFLVLSDFTVFESGYYNQGTLVSAIGTDKDYKMCFGIKFRNFSLLTTLYDVTSPALMIKDWHQGCEIYNISSQNFSTLLKSINNYYTVFEDLRTTHHNEARIGERFIFSGDMNLNVFRSLVAANSLVGYKFDGPLTACHFDAISIEGVTTGIQFNSYVFNCSIVNSYLEGFDRAFEFNSYIYNFTIDNNYIRFVSPNHRLIKYTGLPMNNIHLLSNNTFIGMSGYDQLFENIENNYGYGMEMSFNPVQSDSINNLLTDDFGANFNINGKAKFPTYLANIQNAKGLIPGNYSGQYTHGYDGTSGFEVDSSLSNLVHVKTKIKHTWTQIVYVNLEVYVGSVVKYYKGFFIGNVFYEFGSSGISVTGGLKSIVNSDGFIDIQGGSYESGDIISVKGEVRLI